jgi:hypothetical protein
MIRLFPTSAFFLAVVLLFLSCQESPVRDRVPFAVDRGGVERWGYRDRRGETVIAPVFSVAGPFSRHGIASAADDSGWVVIDVKGRILLRPFIFDNGPDDFSEDLARFTKEDKIGFYDRKGRALVPADYDFALPFSEGLAAVCRGCRQESDGEHRTVRGGSWGFIDRKGRVVIPLRYDGAEPFRGGRAEVVFNGEPRTVDRSGTIGPPGDPSARSFP